MSGTSIVERHTTQVGDVRVHYRRAGSGAAVVLLHGWPEHSGVWEPAMEALGAEFTLIAPDLRGMGYSGRPDAGYDTDTVAADVVGLLDQLGIEEFSLVGHDWGAAVAYALAAGHRDRVRRLAILEMVIPGVGIMEQAMIPQSGGRFLWHMGFQSVPDVAEALLRDRERLYLGHLFAAYAYDPTAVSGSRLDDYADVMRQIGALRASLRYYEDFFDTAERNRVHAATPLEMPVLAYGGEACLGDLTRQCMATLAAEVTGGVIERCGHWVMEERPDWFVDQVGSFLLAEQAPR